MKTKITILVLICIVSILAIHHFFHPGSPKDVATLSSHYNPHEYIINNYSVKFEVPDFTEVKIDTNVGMGEEVLFSLYYTNNDFACRGYIQLWKIENLKEFLDSSKYLSPFDFLSYQISDTKQNNYPGYVTEWTTEYEQQIRSGKEYWLKINHADEVARVSFITDKEIFPDDLKQAVQHTVDSLQIKAVGGTADR
jgi:hypothetical protein